MCPGASTAVLPVRILARSGNNNNNNHAPMDPGGRDDSFFAPTPGAIRRTGRFLQLRRNARPPTLPNTTADSSDLTLADESYLAGAAGEAAGNLSLAGEGMAPEPGSSSVVYEEEETQEQEHEENVDEDDTTYPDSDSSSAAFDPDEDPGGWAERQDELAGLLEVSEEEARALRWGPAIGLEKDARDLSLDEFRQVIDHHLDATEWRFDHDTALPNPHALALPTLSMVSIEEHPIRVLGRRWGGASAGSRVDTVQGLQQVALDNGLGTLHPLNF